MTHPAITEGNIAVITGAGLGIGRELSARLGRAGLRVAMLDAAAEDLEDAAAAVDGEVLPIPCDVSDETALARARDRIAARWGQRPAVLVNNAVTRAGRGFDAPLADWRRAIDVNLMGVILGVRTFLPDMLAAGRPGCVVNLGSKQGITNPPGHPVYNLTKAAVKSFTESLEHDLRQDPARQVTAHLLIPGWTTTGTNAHKPGAWLPAQVVDYLLDALARGAFYIVCPDGEVSEDEDRARILWAASDITEGRPPLSRWHPDWAARFTGAS